MDSVMEMKPPIYYRVSWILPLERVWDYIFLRWRQGGLGNLSVCQISTPAYLLFAYQALLPVRDRKSVV